MIMQENQIYRVKQISESELDNMYQNLLLRLLNFDNLSQSQYQTFILGYLTYIVNRDNLHPISFRFKHTSHEDVVAHTSFWNKEEGAIITFNLKNLEKPKSLWHLTPILNMLEHEIAHNYDFKNWQRTFNPITCPNGKKEYVYKLLSYNALTKIFAGTDYEKFVEHLTHLLAITSRDEMFAMHRAPQKVQKFIHDALSLAKDLKISANLDDMQEVIDIEMHGTKEMLEIAKLFFANKIQAGGKRFNDFKTELARLYDAILTNNYDNLPYITAEKKDYLIKNKQFILYLQDIKPFYDQNIIDKFFDKQITSEKIFVVDILLITNLHYNKHAKQQLQALFQQAKKDNQLEFVNTAIQKLQNTLPFSRTCYQTLFQNEK